MKHQEVLGNARPGMETSLGWDGRLCRESRQGRETRRREPKLSLEGRLGTEGWLGIAFSDKCIHPFNQTYF